jgi:sensor histidine kinase regulating citrate/malate metabolism
MMICLACKQWQYVLFLIVFAAAMGIILRKCHAGEGDITGYREAFAVLFRLELEDIAETLKAQRHNFVNHLQVIYGLYQTGKVERLEEYIQEASKELALPPEINRMAPEEFRHLMQMVAFMAKGQALQLDIHVTERWTGVVREPAFVAFALRLLIQNILDAMNNVGGESRHLFIQADRHQNIAEIMIEAHGIGREDREFIYSVPEPVAPLFGLTMPMTISDLIEYAFQGEITLETADDQSIRIRIEVND